MFVEFTGIANVNCKYNERVIFPTPEVGSHLNKYTHVKLETHCLDERDTRGVADAKKNRALQVEKFNTEQLPFYAILKPQPDGTWKVLERYEEGKINDVAGFAQFLRKPLEREADRRAEAAAR